MDCISNSLIILLCKLCHALHPENSLCKAELSRAFEYAVLCAPKSAANSRILERGTSLGKKTGDPLHSHYVEIFQRNYFYVISG